MLRLRPRKHALSFQNPDHRKILDFLDRLVGYYRNDRTCAQLAYGQLMRPVTFAQPSPMPMSADGHFPLLFHGVFRSHTGEVGIFLVNAGGESINFAFDLDPACHGMDAEATFEVDQIAPDGETSQVIAGKKGPLELAGSLAARGATMFHVRLVRTASKAKNNALTSTWRHAGPLSREKVIATASSIRACLFYSNVWRVENLCPVGHFRW